MPNAIADFSQDIDPNAPHYNPHASAIRDYLTRTNRFAAIEAMPANRLIWGRDCGHVPTLADYAPRGNGKLGPDAFDNI